MQHLKIGIVVALAVILQSSLRVIWPPFVYVDLPLIVVVYFALQRDLLQALVVGVAVGLASDSLSVGLLGAGGFSKTLVAYLVSILALRVMLDNPVIRIPVLAGAALLDSVVYITLHRVLDQPLLASVEDAALKLVATTITGTVVLYLLDQIFSERAREHRRLAFRRRVARGGSRRFGRRR